MNSADAKLYLAGLPVGSKVDMDFKRGDCVLAKFEPAAAQKAGPTTWNVTCEDSSIHALDESTGRGLWELVAEDGGDSKFAIIPAALPEHPDGAPTTAGSAPNLTGCAA